MALLQISEPAKPSVVREHKLAVGIDLGTTNSLVASVKDGSVYLLKDEKNRTILPSVVHYGKDEIHIGDTALSFVKDTPENVILSVKRLLGFGIDEVKKMQTPYQFQPYENSVVIKTEQGNMTPVEISADILRALKIRSEKALGGALFGSVITVPAYFNDAKRQATKDAATLAGLKVLRLLNEPTAAAIAYGLEHSKEGIHVVYDLGGGTFDISVLKLQKDVFKVLATGGDSSLGGDDFDELIMKDCLSKLNLSKLNTTQKQLLRQKAKFAKETLSTEKVSAFSFKNKNYTISRLDFNHLIAPLIKRTLSLTRRALRDAKISLNEVRDIIMVGGSTHTKYVKESVSNFFTKPVLANINPEEVVVKGAAIQANILAGNKDKDDILLLDVLPLSLGIETMGGLVDRIIDRNTTIPTTAVKEFTTFKDGQTAMAIHVVQGERELVSDCRSLGRFELRNIPALVAGSARIAITFQVDADGLLKVFAEEKSHHAKADITIKPSYGLSDEKIHSMLKDSIAFAKEDIKKRQLQEQKIAAKSTLIALESALSSDINLLTNAELKTINKAKKTLLNTQNCHDANKIKKAIAALEKASEAFVAKRMNIGITRAIKGHNIEEF